MSGKVTRPAPQLFAGRGQDDRLIGLAHDPVFMDILQGLDGYEDLVDRATRAFDQFVPFESKFGGDDPVDLILDGKATLDEVLQAQAADRRNRERAEDQNTLSQRLTAALDSEARRWYTEHEGQVIAQLTDRLRAVVERGRKIAAKGLHGVHSWADVEKHPDAAGPWAEFTATVGPEFGQLMSVTFQLSSRPSSFDSSTGLPTSEWPLANLVDAGQYTDRLWPEFWQRGGDVTAAAVPWFEGASPTVILRGIVDRQIELTACTWRERLERCRKLDAKAETQIQRYIAKLDEQNTVELHY